MRWDWLDQRPLLVALAGSKGSGKTTFFHAHLADAGLRFVNAADLARGLDLHPDEAATLADGIRRAMLAKGESFIFETVFSDAAGEKIGFLHEATRAGHQVVLIFIRLPDVETSRQRVAMRVAQGEHDVPDEKLEHRFARTLANLDRSAAGAEVDLVLELPGHRKPWALEIKRGR